MINPWDNFFYKNEGNHFPNHNLIKLYYRKFFKKKKKLLFLDLGAGTGSSLKIFQKKNIHLDLVDNSINAVKKLIENTKNKKNIRIFKSDFNSFLKKNNRKYDLIIDSQSLQHQSIKDLIITYRYIYNSLKKGGYFLSIHLNSHKEMNHKTIKVQPLSEKKIKKLIRKNFKSFEYNIDYYTEDNKKIFTKYNLITAKK